MEQQLGDSLDSGAANLKPYGVGFVLSIVLTTIPFAAVMYGVLPRQATVPVIFIAALVQILVHLHYFLHVKMSAGSRWHIVALLLAVLVAVLIVGGTIWIMAHLDYNLS